MESCGKVLQIGMTLETIILHRHSILTLSRVGYRWFCFPHIPCEVNWLDPEPERESDDYAKYIEELQVIQRGSEEEYRRLIGWESDNESVV